MSENFLDKESLFNKKRKLEKGKEEENYPDLIIKNNYHKSISSILPRKRLSESEFNFNISTSETINHSLTSNNWEHSTNENELTYQNNAIKEIGNENIIINEPTNAPIVEEVDDNYPFLNSQTLQYEFTSEGKISNDSTSLNAYDNNNENFSFQSTSQPQEIKNDRKIELQRRESSLVPFKQDSQVVLYNNNSTGQVILYNKANKSLSIHKVRPLSKEILSRNKRCILCNQLLPSEREDINTNNMFKNSQTFTDSKYFRLLACSLSYTKKPSLTRIINEENEQNISSIHSVNSAENIINLLNDNKHKNTEYMNAHPTITITNSNKETKNENEENSTNNTQGNEPINDSATYLSSSSFNNGYYERFFIERKKLGRGYRGSVFLCHHVLDQVFLGEYAIKKVAVGNNHQWLVRMLKEVMLLEKLRNQNII